MKIYNIERLIDIFCDQNLMELFYVLVYNLLEFYIIVVDSFINRSIIFGEF